MPIKRKRLPSLYELVIGTVDRIYDHGAFIRLDEYNGIEAYCPLNEVARSWFRSIREVLKEGQKAVFKVIRVDRRKMHIDVSLRRVADEEKREKMREWKRALHAEKLLEIAAKQLNKTLLDAYREAGWNLEKYYGEIYRGLEESVKRGIVALIEAEVPERWAKVLYELAQEHIELPEVKVSGIFTIQNYSKTGILAIKQALLKGLEVAKDFQLKSVRLYTIGAPRYKIDLVANSPKLVEQALQKIVGTVLSEAKNKGCTASFERIKTKS